MRSVRIFTYSELNHYEFEHLPKGEMLGLSMNPYNGNVFIKPAKNRASFAVALDCIREVVRACDVLERNGSLDPLRELYELAQGLEYVSSSESVKPEFKAFKGRRENREKDNGEGEEKAIANS